MSAYCPTTVKMHLVLAVASASFAACFRHAELPPEKVTDQKREPNPKSYKSSAAGIDKRKRSNMQAAQKAAF